MDSRSANGGRMLSISEAIREVQSGHMVILCDDEERENEADICLAAQFANPESINFILHEACGLLCMALTGIRLDELRIPLAEKRGDPLQGTGFTLSVDATHGTSTGISARDRATTIRTLIRSNVLPDDLASPGHVFPLRARAGGVLERRGHTEAAIDLMCIAGLEPGAVICEILEVMRTTYKQKSSALGTCFCVKSKYVSPIQMSWRREYRHRRP